MSADKVRSLPLDEVEQSDTVHTDVADETNSQGIRIMTDGGLLEGWAVSTGVQGAG